ncbi:MAG: beta-ketoacyl-[acyl-carrier-protein] synthase family protein, partial [Acidobacteriota bacterium]
EALADAQLVAGAAGLPWAIVFGGGAAGLFEAEGYAQRRLTGGPRVAALTEFLEVPQDAPSDRVAAVYGITGARITVTTACSSSTIAVGLAGEMVRDGEVEVALAGGPDALCRLTFAGFNSLRAADPEPCKPFDLRRQGLTLGEGAAVLVVEDARRARARGATPYASVLGFGATNDAFHMTQPEPTGAAWERTVRAALADAQVGAEAVGYINAHGTATEQNDAAEAAAYRRVFGERLANLPISSTKGALGHCLCGAGGIEAAITALALARRLLPPTVGCTELDPACPIDPILARGREANVEVALSSSFAFGGNSAVLVLGRPR